MKERKSKMNKLQEEIENRHLPELMSLENGDAVTNCADWKLRWEEIKKLLPDTLYDEGNISFFLRSGTHFLGRDDWHAVMKYREEKTI